MAKQTDDRCRTVIFKKEEIRGLAVERVRLQSTLYGYDGDISAHLPTSTEILIHVFSGGKFQTLKLEGVAAEQFASALSELLAEAASDPCILPDARRK